MKTQGFNFQNIKDDNKKIDSIFSIEEGSIKESLDMREERPKKKKVKFDFSHLFQKPKGEKNMGMNDFGDGEPFEGLL